MSADLDLDEFLAIAQRHRATVERRGDVARMTCPSGRHADDHPSMEVKHGDKVPVVAYCHVCGAGWDEVLAVWPEIASTSTQKPKPQIVKRYPYPDGNRKLRWEPGFDVRSKSFTWEHLAPDGKTWVKGRDGGQRLYREDRVEASAAAGGEIWIVEGERDVETLEAFGLVGTCNADGASENDKGPKWLPRFGKHFAGASRVCLVPDNDDAGRAHVNAAARSVSGIADEVRIVTVPGPEKSDVTDFVRRGGTLADLLRLAADAPAYEAASNASPIRSDPDTLSTNGTRPSAPGEGSLRNSSTMLPRRSLAT